MRTKACPSAGAVRRPVFLRRVSGHRCPCQTFSSLLPEAIGPAASFPLNRGCISSLFHPEKIKYAAEYAPWSDRRLHVGLGMLKQRREHVLAGQPFYRCKRGG